MVSGYGLDARTVWRHQHNGAKVTGRAGYVLGDNGQQIVNIGYGVAESTGGLGEGREPLMLSI